MVNPVGQLARGLRVYWTGVSWLKKNPRYLFLLLIPTVLGLVSVVALFSAFWQYSDLVYGAVLFDPGDGFFAGLLYYIAKFFASVAIFILTLVSGLLISNVLSAPLYEMVSVAVERQKTGGLVEVSLWQSMVLIPEELKKVIAILLISVVLMFLPLVNFLVVFVTAFLIGWDFYDYPLARRGWSFKERRRAARKDFWSIMGLGLWLTIPGVQILLYPFAVVGGTLLNLERLKLESKL